MWCYRKGTWANSQIPKRDSCLTLCGALTATLTFLKLDFTLDIALSLCFPQTTARMSIHTARKFVQHRYPRRHSLILGDSTVTVPAYRELPGAVGQFDVVFIDGGHSYDVARADLRNCREYADENTILIFDDVVTASEADRPYNVGPTAVWNEHVANGEIVEERIVPLGRRRGFAIGKFATTPRNETSGVDCEPSPS
jgi:hypothetical protein